MDRAKWTLFAICAAKGRPLTPLQLQKCLFLLGQNYQEEVGISFYEFAPYNYGPFDVAVYEDAAKLAARGFVSIERPAGKSWEEFSATPQGMTVAAGLRNEVPSEVIGYLESVVEWARKLSFRELVSAVYERYPNFRINSVFRG